MKPPESLKRSLALTIVAAVVIILGLSFVGYVGERIANMAHMQRVIP